MERRQRLFFADKVEGPSALLKAPSLGLAGMPVVRFANGTRFLLGAVHSLTLFQASSTVVSTSVKNRVMFLLRSHLHVHDPQNSSHIAHVVAPLSRLLTNLLWASSHPANHAATLYRHARRLAGSLTPLVSILAMSAVMKVLALHVWKISSALVDVAPRRRSWSVLSCTRKVQMDHKQSRRFFAKSLASYCEIVVVIGAIVVAALWLLLLPLDKVRRRRRRLLQKLRWQKIKEAGMNVMSFVGSC